MNPLRGFSRPILIVMVFYTLYADQISVSKDELSDSSFNNYVQFSSLLVALAISKSLVFSSRFQRWNDSTTVCCWISVFWDEEEESHQAQRELFQAKWWFIITAASGER